MKVRNLVSALGIAMFVSGAASASTSYPNEPRFDCTATETKIYIEKVTANVFNPSPIQTPDEFDKAYQEAMQEKAAQGDGEAQSCVSILSDGKLTDEWKRITEQLGNIDFDFDVSSLGSIDIGAIMDRMKEKGRQAMDDAIEKIGSDLCAMISTENLEGLLLDAVNQKYGVRVRDARLSAFADAITDEALTNADKNILLLLSENELKDEVRGATRNEMRQLRKDLWDKF